MFKKELPKVHREMRELERSWSPTAPHEELVPDFCLFRPLSHNNPRWVLYWPELEV